MKLFEVHAKYQAKDELQRLPEHPDRGHGWSRSPIQYVRANYSDFGINSNDIDRLISDTKKTEIDVDSLTTWQDWIYKNKVEKFIDLYPSEISDSSQFGDDPITVLSKGTKHVLIRGNHRAAALKLLGVKKVLAKNIEVKD